MKKIEKDSYSNLLTKVAHGSQSAFSELYNLFYPSLLQHVILKVKEESVAEDILHDLFLSLWNKREQIEKIESLPACVNPALELERAQRLFYKITPELQRSIEGTAYKKLIDAAKSVEVGSIAPIFTMKNTKDEDVNLSSFKGMYVLIDFWASWCAPCRMENPNVVAAYNKFHNKNFTILGVSLDSGNSGKQLWIAAVAKDGLEWEQVSDLKGWANTVARLYQVNAIPANFLVDPSGTIVAKNLRGYELDQKLSQLLSN